MTAGPPSPSRTGAVARSRRRAPIALTRRVLIAILLSGAALSACQARVLTRLDASGSGTMTIEVGLTPDEATQLASLGEGASGGACAVLSIQGPGEGGALPFVEEKRGPETWCVSSQPFKDPYQLEALYGQLDGVILRELVEREGLLVYDLEIAPQEQGAMPVVPEVTWALELPGKLGEHNADRVEGQRLEWRIHPGEARRLTASSDLYGLNMPGGSLPLVIVAVAACLCGAAVVIAAVLFVVLRRRTP